MNDIFVFIEHFQNVVSEISYVCLAQAQHLAKVKGNKVIAILLGKDVEPLSKKLLADEVIIADHPSLAEFTYDTYVSVLTQILKDKKPGLMIFGDTGIGSDLAGGLSVRAELPLVSFCKEIKVVEGKLQFVCQVCGGKVLSEGVLPETGSLVTLLPGKFKSSEGETSSQPKVSTITVSELSERRVKFIDVIMPSGEGPDISKEKILVAIGRGIENEGNVELAQELADELGGVLCASRPVVDQGWLPTTRLVGKSGKTVKPKLYLMLGISGAPEHMEAVEESELVIAVNSDPSAPVFNYANFGTTEDLLDVSEELIRSLQEAKGG